MDRVLIIGPTTIDQVKGPGISVIKMGGVTTYSGITFRKHDLDATVVSKIAKKDHELFQIFKDQGIELLNGSTENTTVFVNHISGNDRRQEMPARSASITADQARHAIGSTDHVHLGPLHPLDLATDLLRLLQKEKPVVSLDVQGYIRRVDRGRVRQKTGISQRLNRALLASSVIKGDRAEIQAILDGRQITIEDLIYLYGLDEVVITAGSEGGRIIQATGQVVIYDVVNVNQVIDTTGAGDVFFAAYLVSRIHRGQTIRESCEHAAFVVAQHLSGLYIREEELWLS